MLGGQLRWFPLGGATFPRLHQAEAPLPTPRPRSLRLKAPRMRPGPFRTPNTRGRPVKNHLRHKRRNCRRQQKAKPVHPKRKQWFGGSLPVAETPHGKPRRTPSRWAPRQYARSNANVAARWMGPAKLPVLMRKHLRPGIYVSERRLSPPYSSTAWGQVQILFVPPRQGAGLGGLKGPFPALWS